MSRQTLRDYPSPGPGAETGKPLDPRTGLFFLKKKTRGGLKVPPLALERGVTERTKIAAAGGMSLSLQTQVEQKSTGRNRAKPEPLPSVPAACFDVMLGSRHQEKGRTDTRGRGCGRLDPCRIGVYSYDARMSSLHVVFFILQRVTVLE